MAILRISLKSAKQERVVLLIYILINGHRIQPDSQVAIRLYWLDQVGQMTTGSDKRSGARRPEEHHVTSVYVISFKTYFIKIKANKY